MGQLRRYIDEKWKALEEYAFETSSMVSLFNNVELIEDVRKAVENIRIEWSNEVSRIMKNYEDDAFGIRFEKACTKSYLQLNLLASKYGIKQVVACAYSASQSNVQIRKHGIQGGAFIWNCFFEEFKAALTLEESFKLHKALVIKGFEGEVQVAEHSVWDAYGRRIGKTTADDGFYRVRLIDGKPYVQSTIKRDTVDLESLEASFKGQVLGIVGFKYNKDIGADSPLNKSRVKELIEDDDYGKHMVKVVYKEEVGAKNRFAIMIRKALKGDQVVWHEVGSIQNSSRVSDKDYARVLKDHILQVHIHDEYKTEPESILSIVIDGVLL
jgi:hypothetical protein